MSKKKVEEPVYPESPLKISKERFFELGTLRGQMWTERLWRGYRVIRLPMVKKERLTN